MANCTICGSSNLGAVRTPLVLVDSQWFCASCLPRHKGPVKCSRCGSEAFSSGEYFKSVDGRYLCTACLEKAGILTKYDYVMEVATSSRGRSPVSGIPGADIPGAGIPSAGIPGAGTPSTGIPVAAQQSSPSQEKPPGSSIPFIGGLRMLLDEHIAPGEVITTAIAGNAGEGIACSRQHIYVLKSGIALGSITGRKCTKIPWSQVKGITIKESSLYGILEVTGNRLPEHNPSDITKAKKSDNAITFLASRKKEFEEALKAMRSLLNDRQNVAD